MATSTKSIAKRVAFAAYDVNEKRAHHKPSATAYMMLRKALFQGGGRPDSAELAGSWRLTAELQMLFSDIEFRHEESAGLLPDETSKTGVREVRVPVIVLNPKGASFVVSELHVQRLRALWDEWVKANAKNSDAMNVHLTYQWFDAPGNVVDADKEPAVASGMVKAPSGDTPAADAAPSAPVADVGVAQPPAPAGDVRLD